MNTCMLTNLLYYTGVHMKVMGRHITKSTARMAKKRNFSKSIAYSNRAFSTLSEYW